MKPASPWHIAPGPIRVATATVACCLAAAVTVGAADAWVEVRSESARVISDRGEGTARKVAKEFDRVRQAIRRAWALADTGVDRPIVVLVTNESTLRSIITTRADREPIAGSVVLPLEDRYNIGLKTNNNGALDARNIAYFAYTTAVLNGTFHGRLPFWLVTGLSGVMSTAIVDDDKLEFGRPAANFTNRLANSTLFPLAELFEMTPGSDAYADPAGHALFEAQCWAFVHLMTFKDGGNSADALNRVITRLTNGESTVSAVASAFGPIDALDRELRDYIKGTKYRYLTFRENTDTITSGPARPLGDGEAAAVRAGFLIAANRIADAESLIANQLRSSDAAELHEVAAVAHDRMGRTTEARDAYRRAVTARSLNFYPYLRVAELTWRAGADTATTTQARTLLMESTRLNDRFSRSFGLLALVHLETNGFEAAALAAQRAINLAPADASPRLALARVYQQMGRREEMLATARQALALARADAERRAAQSFLNPTSNVSGGVTGGAIAGLPLAPPPPPPPPGDPVRVGGDVPPPVKTKHVDPAYPPIAQTANVQGVVIVEATIGRDGTVTNARILRSIPLLDQAALDAVRQWEFAPTLVEGVARPVVMTVTVQFTLN